jgi:filamentous hemagglutinin
LYFNGGEIYRLGGNNNYQYASNPISWIDPLGLVCEERYARYKLEREKGLSASDATKLSKTKPELGSINKNVIRPSIGTKIDGQVQLIETDKLRLGTIETFKNGRYSTVETTESIDLYRKFGGGINQAKMDGAFASTVKNAGRQETAVYQAWSNSRFEAELNIPSGQKLNIGTTGEQPPSSINPKYRGGADQILLPRNWPNEWVQSIRDGKTGTSYSYDEFVKKFPDQIRRK